MKQAFLEAGQIVNTFGVKGEVKIMPWCDSAEFLLPFRTLYIDKAPRRVIYSRVHKDMLIVLFEGVEDLNAAMALKNKVVTFARADAKLPEGRFFIADILGSEVLDETGRAVGRLTDVLELPAGQVYVVEGEDGEHTIPNRSEFILDVNADEGVIRVHMIEGM
jgi:16S rRNA processing protein RimM